MFSADDVARAVVERGTIPVTQQVEILHAIEARAATSAFGLLNFDALDLSQVEQDTLLFQWWQLRRAGEADGR